MTDLPYHRPIRSPCLHVTVAEISRSGARKDLCTEEKEVGGFHRGAQLHLRLQGTLLPIVGGL